MFSINRLIKAITDQDTSWVHILYQAWLPTWGYKDQSKTTTCQQLRKSGPLRLWSDQLPYVVNASRTLTSHPTINGSGKSAIDRWTEMYGWTLSLCIWGHLLHRVPWTDHALPLSCLGWAAIGSTLRVSVQERDRGLIRTQEPRWAQGEFWRCQCQFSGGSRSDNGEMRVQEAGFSATNGKKWFPKGYKATTQKRCAEKQMRKWFCENNSLDPVHPKQTTLPVLTDTTAWLFPNRNKKQIYPKLVACPPSSTNALTDVQLRCVCLDSLLHTQTEFSHNWPLPQLVQPSLLWGAPLTFRVSGSAAVKLLTRATPLLVYLVLQ